jgi:hypothetical protein
LEGNSYSWREMMNKTGIRKRREKERSEGYEAGEKERE